MQRLFGAPTLLFRFMEYDYEMGALEIYTVSFFGHRYLDNILEIEAKLEELIRQLLEQHEYCDFLIGRDGDFDQCVSSSVLRVKKSYRDDNSSLILVLPYPRKDYLDNQDSFEAYYDEIEICEKSSLSHFKSAFQIRNQEMINRSDLVIFNVDHESGGAYQTLKYAKHQGKELINITDYSI